MSSISEALGKQAAFLSGVPDRFAGREKFNASKCGGKIFELCGQILFVGSPDKDGKTDKEGNVYLRWVAWIPVRFEEKDGVLVSNSRYITALRKNLDCLDPIVDDRGNTQVLTVSEISGKVKVAFRPAKYGQKGDIDAAILEEVCD